MKQYSSVLKFFPFFLEFFLNGSFIIFYLLNKYQKFPPGWDKEVVRNLLDIGGHGVPMVVFFNVILNYLNLSHLEAFFRKYVFSLIILVALFITWGDLEFCFWLSAVHILSSLLTLYEIEGDQLKNTGRIPRKFYHLHPAQIVIFTFCGLILIGTTLLMLPLSSGSGKSLSFIDAFFMATSAACVTGLTTLSVGTNFSLFGQIVLLLLVQIGGLGIMTLSYGMTVFLGKSMAMKERVVLQDILEGADLDKILSLVMDILKYTFIIEFWGGVLLTLGFVLEGLDFGKAIYFGFFHSISAFCNVGFSLFDNSLENFATSPLIHGTIGILISLGGLGFVVVKELWTILSQKQSFNHLSLHSKTVLVISLALVISATLMIFFGEYLNSLDNYSLWEKFQIALFQSVTLRSAGFSTIPLGTFHPHTIYLMSMFMFIGAGPGSTGGGIKTTSFAILVQSIRSTLKGESTVHLFKRTIPDFLVVRTTALTMISIIMTTFFIFILMKIESEQTFLSLFFEAISAVGTAGLSLGITPYLTISGKMAISLLMFIGRIGPLTLVLALGQQSKSGSRHELPDGKIMIG